MTVRRTLVGGSYDGQFRDLPRWQKSLFMPRRITLAESDALRISDTARRKPPEEFYELNDAGQMVYSRTITY